MSRCEACHHTRLSSRKYKDEPFILNPITPHPPSFSSLPSPPPTTPLSSQHGGATLAATGRAQTSDDLIHEKSSAPSTPAADDAQNQLAATTSNGEIKKPRSNNRSCSSSLLVALCFRWYQNSLMTMTNVVFRTRYGTKVYTPDIQTRISNASLVGAIIGQIAVGLICDRVGRKAGVTTTTNHLVLGAIFATAAVRSTASQTHVLVAHRCSWMRRCWRRWRIPGIVHLGLGGCQREARQEASLAGLYPRHQPRARLGYSCLARLLHDRLEDHRLSRPEERCRLQRPRHHLASRLWFRCSLPAHHLLLPHDGPQLIPLPQDGYAQEGPLQARAPKVLEASLGHAGVWFIYDFVVFPLGVFSGTIISTVLHNPPLIRVAEWQFFLSFHGLPGTLIGAYFLPKSEAASAS